MTTSLISQLTVIGSAGVAAPVLAELSGRLAVPGVVMELLLGIVIGPQVLGWVSPAGLVLDFSNVEEATPSFLHETLIILATKNARLRPINLTNSLRFQLDKAQMAFLHN